MSKISARLLFILISLLAIQVLAESNRKDNDITISGYVFDAETRHAVSYANILLFSSETQKQVNGIATNDEGFFMLQQDAPGNYYIEVHFIGYEKKTLNDIVLDPENDLVDLGDIIIQPDIMSTDVIGVEGQRSPITYQIDKKVIHVDEQLTASSGTAVDVLENVPSVTVDIEGNVSLRGSGNFTVMIDGRPTIMDANDALQQISAASIEDIEIITNPSAKYDPEGTAGIINLVMKKNKNQGFSGIAEANGGYRNRYGGQFLLNYKTDIYRMTVDVGYNQRARYGDEVERNITTIDGISAYRNSSGSSDREGDRVRIRAEMGLQLSSDDYFSVGGSFDDGIRKSLSDVTFSEWTDLAQDVITNRSATDRQRGGNDFELFMNYEHKFNNKGHLLKAEAEYESENNEESTITELMESNRSILEGTKTTEDGPASELQLKIDYTLPFDEDRKFEAGYQNEIESSEEKTGYYDYNLTSNEYEFISAFSNNINYRRGEHALYALYASKINAFGFQTGFRAEYTDRKIELLENNNNTFVLDRWDYFPSLHSSYEFNKSHQVMASYTRRIDRPRGWYLEPFQTWMDAYNVREGNPAIKPEYIDSYEAGYQALLGGLVFSSELYHRMTHNKIERVRSVYREDIYLHQTLNIGTDYATGAEIMFNFDPLSDWNVNLMGNMYNYRVEGIIFEENFSRESYNWNARFNNRVKLFTSTQLQVNMSYNSPTVSSQGERKGFFYTHLAVRQDFFNKSLTATLQVRDLFGNANYKSITEGDNFYSYRNYTRQTPEIMLNLRYFINRQGNDRDRNRNGQGGPDNDSGDDF